GGVEPEVYRSESQGTAARRCNVPHLTVTEHLTHSRALNHYAHVATHCAIRTHEQRSEPLTWPNSCEGCSTRSLKGGLRRRFRMHGQDLPVALTPADRQHIERRLADVRERGGTG